VRHTPCARALCGLYRLQKVDVTCYTFRNGVVRVEDAESTLYASIDIVCDKVGPGYLCAGMTLE